LTTPFSALFQLLNSTPDFRHPNSKLLRKAVDDARSTFQKATNDDDYKLRGTYYHVLIETNLPQILGLAKTNPASETAFEMFSSKWGDSKSAANEAERQLENVVANYADCRDLRPRDSKEQPRLKTEAEKELIQLLHFSLGKVARDIEAESIEGKKFKLSDSRGKITVLSFWASWCGPCMQLAPVERALTERMKGKPFTLVGVNGDGILPDAQRAAAHEKMTWPSFWNGKDGAHGPISSAWNVSDWPTVYVLDANGIIRFKFEGYGNPTSNLLNGTVDKLMKDLESR
jgi:thiol-disulfide isomerase/thioredoxin